MVLVVAIALAVFWLPRGWGIAAVAAAAAFEIAEAAFWIKLSRRRKPAVGAEALVGSHGEPVLKDGRRALERALSDRTAT